MAVKQKVVDNQHSTAANNTNPQLPDGYFQYVVRVLQEAANLEQGNKNRATMCANVCLRLGAIPVPTDPENFKKFVQGVEEVQEILQKECGNQELVLETLTALYEAISDSNKNLSPAMSIVLQLLDKESIPGAVDYILTSKNATETHLKLALKTLCFWLSRWTFTPNLGPLVLEFIRGLERESRYNILLSIASEFSGPLFRLLALPDARPGVAPVVLHFIHRARLVVPVVDSIKSIEKNIISALSRDDDSKLLELVVAACNKLGNSEISSENDVPPWPTGGTETISNIMQIKCNDTVLSGGPIGLNNLGNTCYINAALQVLYCGKNFREAVLNFGPIQSPFGALQLLFAILKMSGTTNIPISDLINALRPNGFAPGRQHDSSEFLECLLDSLDDQERKRRVLNSQKNTKTLVDTYFGGTVKTISTCSLCNANSERSDSFRSLQLSFPPSSDNDNVPTCSTSIVPSVQSLLDYFERPERLCGDNQYRCDNCEKLGDGIRTANVSGVPPRLVLTLKQFRYDPALGGRAKLRRKVLVNQTVLICGKTFELYAAIVHCGASADAGHYYALARHGDLWYRLDDNVVSGVPNDTISRLVPPHAPYVLMYEEVGQENASGGGSGEGAEVPLAPHLQQGLRRRGIQ